MNALQRAGIGCACCALVAGCAGPATSTDTASNATSILAGDAREAIIIGKSTRADVLAALGKTTVIGFDSGFEVWVYQARQGAEERIAPAGAQKGTAGTAELVVLFAPSGVVTKTRIRPMAVPGAAKGK